MTNEELITVCNLIDKCHSHNRIVTNYTKMALKSLLISGANPDSQSFKERFPDEYYLYCLVTNRLS